jgi:hypothetical protein
LLADIAQTIYELLGKSPCPSVADLFYLLFAPLMLCGLLRFAVGHRSVSERVRLGLDLAVVAIGASVVVLYVVLGPTIVAGGGNVLQEVLSVTYPVTDMVLLFAVAGAAQNTAAPPSELRAEVAHQRASWPPYLASALGFGLLIFSQRHQSFSPISA